MRSLLRIESELLFSSNGKVVQLSMLVPQCKVAVVSESRGFEASWSRVALNCYSTGKSGGKVMLPLATSCLNWLITSAWLKMRGIYLGHRPNSGPQSLMVLGLAPVTCAIAFMQTFRYLRSGSGAPNGDRVIILSSDRASIFIDHIL